MVEENKRVQEAEHRSVCVCVTLQSLQREIHCGSAVVVVVVTADQLVSIISFSEYTWASLTRSDLARMQIWGGGSLFPALNLYFNVIDILLHAHKLRK